MKANMHLHSRYSDGTNWPGEIPIRADSAGIRCLSLTDHDTLGGTVEFARAASAAGIQAIPGVEIDCREPSIGYKSELLAYFPQGNYKRTESFLEEICADRLGAAKEALQRASVHFNSEKPNFSELLAYKRAGRTEMPAEAFSFNKVDIFLHLKAIGLIPGDMDYKLFKKTYFDSRILLPGGRDKPLCSEVCAVVLSDGGFLVLPHIGHEFNDDMDRLKKEQKRLDELLDYFISIGIRGIELYHYRNGRAPEINKYIRKRAKERKLFLSYGSDCHGLGSGKDTITLFSGNFKGFPKK
jgi:3',5'-nucleoside bisphosphate phosphatase